MGENDILIGIPVGVGVFILLMIILACIVNCVRSKQIQAEVDSFRPPSSSGSYLSPVRRQHSNPHSQKNGRHAKLNNVFVVQLDKPTIGIPCYGIDLQGVVYDGYMNVYVAKTGPGLPAHEAGVRAGMKVLEVNGEDMGGADKATVGQAITSDPWHVTLTLMNVTHAETQALASQQQHEQQQQQQTMTNNVNAASPAEPAVGDADAEPDDADDVANTVPATQ